MADLEANTLEHLQNYAAGIILGRDSDTSATVMRCELGWPMLAPQRKLMQ